MYNQIPSRLSSSHNNNFTNNSYCYIFIYANSDWFCKLSTWIIISLDNGVMKTPKRRDEKSVIRFVSLAFKRYKIRKKLHLNVARLDFKILRMSYYVL